MDARLALAEFLLRVGPCVRLLAVVAMELRAGARTRAQQTALTAQTALAALIGAYTRRDLLVVPSAHAWDQAGRVLADLAVKERFDTVAAPASFPNDVLIATSCREVGATLVTENHADFARIRRHLRGLRISAPWPRS